jgi:uncharacterized membrane protein
VKSSTGGEESQKEQVDRELIELLNELRVALPGVQVLFAFLLTLPFSQRFGQVTRSERDVYFAAFGCATVATALLIAPSAYHRIHFRRHDKEQLLETSNRLAIAGTVFLALAVACVVYLITDFLYHVVAAAVATAVVAGCFGWFWYGLPLSRLRQAPP